MEFFSRNLLLIFTALKRLGGICPGAVGISAVMLTAEVSASFIVLSDDVVFNSCFVLGVKADECATSSAFPAATAVSGESGDSGRGNLCKPKSGTPSCCRESLVNSLVSIHTQGATWSICVHRCANLGSVSTR